MLYGQIDQCQGRNIFGWAVPVAGREHCEIMALDTAGRVLASTIASEPRGDLISVGKGRTDFSFRLGVAVADLNGPVRVLADGVEMPGSPLQMGPDFFDGHLWIKDGEVTGWVSSREAVSAIVPVELYDQDGQHVASVPTTLSPPSDDKLFRTARFSAPVPAGCLGRRELALSAKAGAVIFAKASGSARLSGHLDTLSAETCGGWLFSPDDPGRRLEIAVYRDGELIGSGVTDLERSDVRSVHPDVGRCGFTFALKPNLDRKRGPAHVSVRLVGSDHELFDGPFLIGPRPGVMQDALDAALSVDQTLLGDAGATLLRHAFGDWMRAARGADEITRTKARRMPPGAPTPRRITIVIPVHSNPEATRVCLERVLRDRSEGRDSIIIVNDNPYDNGIGALIASQLHHPDIFVLRNEENRGFVLSVNRALEFARGGDVLLLNSDTELYAGALDEMHGVLHSSPEIGTVTAISNNATLFSYPHPTMIEPDLEDIAWVDLAAAAMRENAGKTVNIPTGHGFCMLMRREMIDEVGLLDPSFGRGYGEENDYCLRASDRLWRHVAAGGVLVRHLEAASFGSEKDALLATNLRILDERYPEYGGRIERFAAMDELRRLRWALDFHRLRQIKAAGGRFDLIIDSGMGGGTQRAADDIQSTIDLHEVRLLRLAGQKDGSIHLTADGLRMLAVFKQGDVEDLFQRLAALDPDRVVVHHLLGFQEVFVRRLRGFMPSRRGIFHVHDFYYGCPRVTLIDALGEFCGGAAPDRCDRCIGLAGAHAADRLQPLPVREHRALFQDLLGSAAAVIAPSRDAADRVASLLPDVRTLAIPHPQSGMSFPIGLRRGTDTDICLLGAIGPHKGSETLLALARYARLNHPAYHFHVVGFTNVDKDLTAVGNVTIHGAYERADLPALVEKTQARIALFLHGWPETFSYTLSEAVSLGLIPVVPDIGAPAERVRQAGFGVVFPFPIDLNQVMTILAGVASGALSHNPEGALPLDFENADSAGRLQAVYNGATTSPASRVAVRKSRRSAARG